MCLKMRYFFILFTFFGLYAWSQPALNLDKKGLALEGFDPVSYFRSEAQQKGPLKGQPQFSTNYSGATYYFASDANKQEFLRNPSRYVPAFGGWCAYAVAVSKEKVEVDPKSFVIQEGRLLLFYDGILADTRKKWLNTKNKSSQEYLKEADAHWPDTIKK